MIDKLNDKAGDIMSWCDEYANLLFVSALGFLGIMFLVCIIGAIWALFTGNLIEPGC
jgi:hypothetical protein